MEAVEDTYNPLDDLKQVGDLAAKISLDGADALTEVQLVRVVPNRRLVCRAKWKRQSVFAKIFIGAKSDAYASRDKRGVDWLVAANLPTPPLLAVQRLDNDEGTVLIYQAIRDSVNAEDAYMQMDALTVRVLMTQLVKTVAQHHRASILQTDLYLKNFLIKGQSIYTLDGDGVRHYQKLSNHKAKHNLAVLLSKFDVLHLNECCYGLLEEYALIYPNLKMDEGEMKKLADYYRSKAATDYADKKVFRTCSDVTVSNGAQHFSAVASHYQQLRLPHDVLGFDGLINQAEMLKQGNTCSVGVVHQSHCDIVVKRYNIKSIFHALSRCLRQTRASVSWANAHRLQLLGIATPRPVALFEQRRFGFLRGKAFFLSAYVDLHDMHQFFQHAHNKQLRATAIKNVVQLFYRLHLLKLSHGDTKATNIKVLDNGMPLLIDLDSMQQHRYRLFADKAHVRDLKRFMQNWKEQPALYNAFVDVFQVIYAEHDLLRAADIVE